MSIRKAPPVIDTILDAIGNTPLLRLRRICQGVDANVLVKCEYLNPSGSIKDRMARRMVETLEAEGRITPGQTLLVEASSGNTAIALAMVGAVKKYPVKIFFSAATDTLEKVKILERYGANLEVLPLEDDDANQLAHEAGLHGATIEIPGRLKCLRAEQDDPKVVWVRQFSNPANVEAQSEVGREILEQTARALDVFIAAIGTGGTFLGVSRVLKQAIPGVKCIAVEPGGWQGWESPISPKRKYIPGISGGIVQEIRDMGVADEVIRLGDKEAKEMAYRLSREEGLQVGISSGACVYAALEVAKRPEMKGKTIVTILVDRGDRYITDERFIT